MSDPESGEWVCTRCGAVNLRKVVFDERRIYREGRGGRPARLGAKELHLSTMMGSSARARSSASNPDGRRLSKLNEIIWLDSKRRNFLKATREISRVTDALSLGRRVAERAFEIYRSAYREGLVRGRSIKGIAAASVFLACKEFRVPRPERELLAVLQDGDLKRLRYDCRVLVQRMGISVESSPPAVHVPRIVAKAGLSPTVERSALEMVSSLGRRHELTGKRPVSIATAAVYLAARKSGEKASQLDIASASGVTPITIRKRTNEVASLLGIDLA
jgi:transcription initiation factor TFIIB